MRHLSHHASTASSNLTSQLSSPRLPPYPHPTTVYAAVQMRQATVNLLGSATSTITSGVTQPASGGGGGAAGGGGMGVGGGGVGKTGQQGMNTSDSVCVAACFAKSRGWVLGSPNINREGRGQQYMSLICENNNFKVWYYLCLHSISKQYTLCCAV